MSDGRTIEWLAWPGYKSASWNPTRGCTRVSEGCRNCYAEVMAARFNKPGQWGHGLAEMRGGDHRWTGHVELDEAKLLLPLRWRTPRVIFVNSTSDLFHERLPDEAIDKVFAVASLVPRHLLIILTKRIERARAYVSATDRPESIRRMRALIDTNDRLREWPLPNVILGVSIEDQETADERIPHLLATPAACRMVSAEPLLGAVKLREVLGDDWLASGKSGERRGLDWIVTGGESGPGARPMHPDWARSIRDQCQEAGVPFFFKQWGEWLPWSQFGQSSVADRIDATAFRTSEWDGEKWGDVGYPQWCDIVDGSIDDEQCVGKVGKRRAGRLLDGRTHDEFPDISPKIPA